MDDGRTSQRTFRRVRTDEERDRDARLRDLLDGVDWEDVSARLTASAHRMMRKKRPIQDAEEVAQKAIMQLIDPDYKDWNPDEMTLEDHLASVAQGIVRNLYTSVRERTTRAIDDVEKTQRKRGLFAPTVEDEVAAREVRVRIFAGLRERFCGKPLESALVELFAAGVHLPRDQMKEIGPDFGSIYKARARVLEEARRIHAALENVDVEE